jgi:hypothetical protein
MNGNKGPIVGGIVTLAIAFGVVMVIYQLGTNSTPAGQKGSGLAGNINQAIAAPITSAYK